MVVSKITLKMPEGARALLRDPSSTLHKSLYAAITDISKTVQRNVKKNVVPGWGMGHKTRMPFFTGSLNRSIAYEQTGLKTLIGSNLVYAEIQEYGGDIVPKTAKALFIPMSSLGRKTGPQKGGGSGLVFGTDFILSQKVTIKPKSYFARGMESSIESIMNILGKSLSDLGENAGLK